nr:GTP pyrophosphokinase family protein [Lachnospiraceae bacterium]
IAGIRVICSFEEDVFRIARYFLEQDDITLIEKKDYINNPKPNGYRSLHLIVQVPIFTELGKKQVYVEVQLRTIAMDFWASLEHKLRYKKTLTAEQLEALSKELAICADECADLDRRMEYVRSEIVPEN